MSAPFTITLWDKAFTRKGWIGNPRSVEVHPRHNQLPTAILEVDPDHKYAGAFLAEGARVTIEYDGAQIISGPIRAREGDAAPDAPVVLTVEDDWRLLTRLLAWPAPTHAITAQGADDVAFDTKTGPAETVAKWFISRNATRLGLPVTVATDLGRGDTITVSLRMMPPADRLLPLLDQAGIGVSVRQVGATLVADCYEVNAVPTVLSMASGVVQQAGWDTQGPSATRVVVGGGGFKKDRDFFSYVNASLEASLGDVVEVFVDAEDAYSDAGQARDKWLDAVADLREKEKDLTVATKALHVANRTLTTASRALTRAFHANDIAQNAYDDGHTPAKLTTLNDSADDANAAQDDKNDAQSDKDDAQDDYDAALTARNTAVALVATTLAARNTTHAAYLDEIDARGAEALANGAPLAGLKLTLAETTTFRYGRTVRVGDLVTTAVVPGATPITDVLREAVLKWDINDGFTVEPVVGDRSDDPNRTFARAVASLSRAVRNLKARG